MYTCEEKKNKTLSLVKLADTWDVANEPEHGPYLFKPIHVVLLGAQHTVYRNIG